MRCLRLPHAALLAALSATLPARDALAEPAPVAPAPLGRAAPPAPPPLRPAALAPSPPPPDREPPILGALLAGVTTAVIPLVIGGSRAANGDTLAAKNAGFIIATGGLTLAPVMAHLAVREWKRAAIFGALPAAAAIGMSSLLLTYDKAAFSGTTLSRTTFSGLFSLTLFASGLGIVDAMLAGRRANGTGGGLLIGPSISRTRTTLEVGGPLPL